VLDGVVELPRFVEVGVRDELDGNPEGLGAVLQDSREVRSIGVTAAEGVGDVGVGFAQIPPECTGVDLAQTDDIPVQIRESAISLTWPRCGTPDGETPPLITIGSSGSRASITSATASAQNACSLSRPTS